MFGAPGGVISNNYQNGGSWGWGTCTDCVTSTEDVSTLFRNYSSGDYHLGPSSQAVNSGFTLSSPYNVDADGVSRPQGPAWDIGAHEVAAGSTTTIPMPPTLLRVN